MRDITLARNGLWSDEDNIVNLTGLRRELEISEAEDHQVQWNDTMVASWIETDAEGNEIKHCKHYTATTEPGNRDANRMMAPQTMTVLLGLHSSRQPAGRTEKLLIKESDNNNNGYDFDKESWEAGMNLHPGGFSSNNRGGMTVETNKLSGFPSATGAITEEDFNNHLCLVEIFYILFKYGEDRTKSAFDYLKEYRDEALLINEADRTPFQIYSIEDYTKISELLNEEVFNSSMKDYIKKIVEFDLDNETQILNGNTTVDGTTYNNISLNDSSKEISYEDGVSSSSEGCQVIFGGASFYEYLWNTVNKAEDSGQRRWYYTLINITSNYEAITTAEGLLED